MLRDVNGKIFEAGVGTGHNLPFYPSSVDLVYCDFSATMLLKAKKRAKKLNFNACDRTLFIETTP